MQVLSAAHASGEGASARASRWRPGWSPTARLLYKPLSMSSCGVVSKNLAKMQPPLSGSFSCAITIFSLSSPACLTCSASRSSDHVSRLR